MSFNCGIIFPPFHLMFYILIYSSYNTNFPYFRKKIKDSTEIESKKYITVQDRIRTGSLPQTKEESNLTGNYPTLPFQFTCTYRREPLKCASRLHQPNRTFSPQPLSGVGAHHRDAYGFEPDLLSAFGTGDRT